MTYSLDLRERAVSYVRNGGRQKDACFLFKVGRTTLHRWLKAKSLRPSPAKTRYRKIDREALLAHVRSNPDALLRERAAKFNVSVPAISYILKQMKIVKKNDTLR